MYVYKMMNNFFQVDGKRGHIPKNVVMETRVLVRDADLKYIVTSGTKDDPISENRVEINVKTTPQTVVEPTIDIVNLKPEMAPVMQGAFLLAGAAAEGMTSSPKIPDAAPDAVKNARSPEEDDKAPAEVHEVDSDSEIETGLSSDDNVALDVDDNITSKTDSALKEPTESVPKFDTFVDNKLMILHLL
ncbi:hypothetical protein LSTR_LSTR016495 [Laodelphax striatellus]|uniref:Uncharacterized protein n=1 Tax=Laodelphax striatellus TaxID=195883 RepID=A0A482X386_LAOST|nr:hypothetical protein LSTR_LSTR016495 [Laodelphax striatellus]